MDSTQNLAYTVIKSLRHLKGRIDSILDPLEARERIGMDQVEPLQNLLTLLKEELNTVAKKIPSNKYEKSYLIPAAVGALNKLKVRVNSNPINSDWTSSLSGSLSEIQLMLGQLEEEFPAA